MILQINRKTGTDKQHISFYFVFSFISMYFCFPSLFDKLGCILRTFFKLLLLFRTCI